MHFKTALLGLNFDAFEYSWDETGGATRFGLTLLETENQLFMALHYMFVDICENCTLSKRNRFLLFLFGYEPIQRTECCLFCLT